MSYSAFFSSGLLAPRFTLSLAPTSLETAYEDCSDIDVDTDREITPTPTPSSESSQSSFNNSNPPANAGPVQRLRKRRSSVSLAQSPVKAIKAVPRGLLNSPARARSGSVGTNMKATEGTSLIGRMRSGSVGTALR